MERSKKRAKKAVGEGQPAASAVQTEVNPPADKYTSSWDEEELVDYEPDEPERFSPVEEDISVDGDDFRPTEMGRPAILLLLMISCLSGGRFQRGGAKTLAKFSGESRTSRKASRAGPEAEDRNKHSVGVGSPSWGAVTPGEM